jgi:hypothetical protein
MSMDDNQLKQVYKDRKENIPCGNNHNVVNLQKNIEDKYKLKNGPTKNPFHGTTNELDKPNFNFINPQQPIVLDATPIEYLPEILSSLLEEQHCLGDCYSHQTDISVNMRAILINWLYDVYIRFKLRIETLFLAVYLLDRYTQKNMLYRNRLQLIGATCLWTASKYEEVYYPEIKDMIFICDNAVTTEDILQAEYDLLVNIGFSIGYVSPVVFLDFINYTYKLTTYEYHFCKMVLDCCLIYPNTNYFLPAQLAGTSIYIIKMMLHTGNKDHIEPILTTLRLSDGDVLQCRQFLLHVLNDLGSENNRLLLTMKKRYSCKQFSEASDFSKLKNKII